MSERSDRSVVVRVANAEWRRGVYDCFERDKAVRALDRIEARAVLRAAKKKKA